MPLLTCLHGRMDPKGKPLISPCRSSPQLISRARSQGERRLASWGGGPGMCVLPSLQHTEMGLPEVTIIPIGHIKALGIFPSKTTPPPYSTVRRIK